jgi:PKD repeat protein
MVHASWIADPSDVPVVYVVFVRSMKRFRSANSAATGSTGRRRKRPANYRRTGLRFETLEPRNLLAANDSLAADSARVLGDPPDAWDRAAMTAQFDPWLPLGPQPASTGPHQAAGDQSVLFIRARFLDRDFAPSSDYSDAVIRQRLAAIDDFYRSNSFGIVAYPDALLDIVPGVVTIPRTVFQLNQAPDTSGEIHHQARELAQSLGYDLGGYDAIVVLFPDMSDGGQIPYGGLATIGGPEVWLHNSLSASLWAHELGHGLGAGHSGFFQPDDPFQVVGLPAAGQHYPYGNHLDLMGGGNLETGDFSAYWKTQLGWLAEPEQVAAVTASGNYDVYALEEGAAEPDRVYALRIPRIDGQEYWVEHRARSGNDAITNGLVFNWLAGISHSEPALIDMTPASRPGDYREDRLDAALPIGRTFSDWPAALHVTAAARDTTPGSGFVQVVVQRGDFPDNVPPWATVAADTTTADTGQTVTFAATADSRDGDVNLLFWDFGDGTTKSGSLSVEHHWSAAGEYPVRFAVSDTKGGLAEQIVLVRVGPQAVLSVPQPALDTTVNASTTGDQRNPAVASNGDDRLVVVWESSTPDGSGTGIFAQRMLGDGTQVGSPLLVSASVAGDPKNPDVAMAANGDFVVVWQGRESVDTSSDEIYAQRFAWNGTKAGQTLQVNTYTFANQEKPAIAIEPVGGEFVVAWSSAVLHRNVSYRRYAADGTPRDAVEQNAPGGRHFSNVDVAMFQDGGFVLVWDNDSGEEGGADTSGLGVYAQVYGSDGTADAGPLSINATTAGDQRRPRVATDGQSDFTVVWSSIGQDGDGSGVFLRSFHRNGTPISGEVQANETTAKDQSAPAIAIDGQGRRIVSWRDGLENTIGPTDGNNAHRIFSAAGAPLTPESRTSGVQTDYFAGPDVVALGNPTSLVIVNPERQNAHGVDVRARFFALAEPIRAGQDEIFLDPGGGASIDATSNDHSPNGGPLRLSLHGRPSAGSVELLAAGTPDAPVRDLIRYTPAAGFRGTDSFTYQVTDAVGAAALGVITVHVGVQAPNSSPVAHDDFLKTVAGRSLLIGDRRLLANDHDPDNDPLTVIGLASPAHGTLQDLGDGVWSYLPPSGFAGVDQLTYVASDGRGGSATGTVHIEVGAEPVGLRPGDLLIYRGVPASINGAADVASAAAEFAEYEHVLLGDGYQAEDHPNRASTAAIVNHPAASDTAFYGYVDLGVGAQSLPLDAVCNQIGQWQSIGVSGVLLDGFGYDSGTPRTRQNEAVACAHRWGLNVVANGYQPDHVFGGQVDAMYNPAGESSRLTAADYYLYEGFQIAAGADVSEADWQAKASGLDAYRAALGFGILAVTTIDAGGQFDPQRFAYAWYSVLLYGYDAIGWGEPAYAAGTGLAPWRSRPAIDPGVAFVGDVQSASPLVWRSTDLGTIQVNAATREAGFLPNATDRPWQNPRMRHDVDDNGFVQPLDVLALINELNRNGSRILPAPHAGQSPPPYWDVNGDGRITPADVLDVIIYLNA